MKHYTQRIFPRLLDESMARAEITGQRRALLAGAQGAVLEIGAGSGQNLACYPGAVRSVAAVDIHPVLLEMAANRRAGLSFAVTLARASAEDLPFSAASFDTVVTTWTLCSIADVRRALEEVRRVLKPGGSFYFIEHGRSPDAGVRVLQAIFTPLYQITSGNCHLNRDIPALMQDAGLMIERMETYYMNNAPRFSGYTFRGVARKEP